MASQEQDNFPGPPQSMLNESDLILDGEGEAGEEVRMDLSTCIRIVVVISFVIFDITLHSNLRPSLISPISLSIAGRGGGTISVPA
jgi:hypothetical protein